MSPSKYLPMFHFPFYEAEGGVIIYFGTKPKLFWDHIRANIMSPLYKAQEVFGRWKNTGSLHTHNTGP